MCGRYAIYTEEENLEIREIIRDINDRYANAAGQLKLSEIFPTNVAPAIVADHAGIEKSELLKWGFSNSYFKNGVIINARCESIFEKPTFRRIIPVCRCLLPASCFFEWKANESGKKIKYAIRPADDTCFYMAGIYDSGNFVIITTDASAQMASLHDRMPVIFPSREEALEWIKPSSMENGIVQARMVPYRGKLDIAAA